MSLCKPAVMTNSYNKKNKKSIHFERIDIFILLSIFILAVSPAVFKFISYLNAKSRQVNLYLSAGSQSGGKDFFTREFIENMLFKFEEQNPDIKIILLGEETEVHANKKKHPDKEDADILIFNSSELSGLIASGKLIPLKTFSGNTGNSTTWESADDEPGVQFAIPLVSFMDLLFYNTELLQSAGFDRPPKTRDEFLSYAKTVSGSGNDVYGAAMGLSHKDKQAVHREIFSWIWASGNDLLPDGNIPVFDSRPIIRDIDFFGKLNREGVLAPNSFDKTGDQVLEEFAHGKIAMMIASTSAIPELRKKMEVRANSGAAPSLQFGITTLPLTNSYAFAAKYSIGLSGIFVGINSGNTYSEKRLQARNQAAITFLEFLAEQVPAFCVELEAVPGDAANLYSNDYKNYMKDDPIYSKAWYLFESSQIVQGFSKNVLGAEYEKIVSEEMQIFFETNRTAEETAEAIQERINKILENEPDSMLSHF